MLLQRYAYTELASVKAEHNEFTGQAARFVNDFGLGRDAIMVELLDAMQEWLKRHFLGSDAEYYFFQANGIADIKLPQQAPM